MLFLLDSPLEDVVPQHLFRIGPIDLTNQMVMAFVAFCLMLLIFPPLFRKPQSNAPHGFRNLFESALEFLRVEVFRPALKEHTDRFVPFLWTQFFFILFCNLLGFIPLAAMIELLTAGHLKHFGGPPTGAVSITGGLAIAAFIFIHVNGLQQVARLLMDGTYGHHPPHEEHTSNGSPSHEAAHDLEHLRAEGLPADVGQDLRAIPDPVGHYNDDRHLSRTGAVAPAQPTGNRKMSFAAAWLLALPLYLWNFAPHPFKPQPGQSNKMWLLDVPMFIMLLALEFISAAIKPLALCVRLFSNMVAGHVLLAVLITLIVMAPIGLQQLALGVPLGALDLGIQLLELFVAFLQAYIFTFLTTLFLASAVAPEH